MTELEALNLASEYSLCYAEGVVLSKPELAAIRLADILLRERRQKRHNALIADSLGRAIKALDDVVGSLQPR